MDSLVFMANFTRPSRKAISPVLLLAAGLPASGKSYFVHELAKQVSLAHLNTDEIRNLLSDGKPTFSGEENYVVHTTAGKLAAQLLGEGYHVVYDATSVLARDRKSALQHAAVSGARTAIAWCEVSESVAAARLAARAAGLDERDHSSADESVRRRMLARHSKPGTHEASALFYVSPETVSFAVDSVRLYLNSAEPRTDTAEPAL